MKKFNGFNLMAILALFSVLLITTSCETDDDNGSSVNIEGNWIFNDVAIDFTVDGVSFVDYLVGLGLDQASAQAFVDEEMGKLEESFGAPAAILMNEGGTFVATSSDGSTSSGTWVLSSDGKTLTITEGADIMEFTVVSLTSSQLIISVSETDMADLDDDVSTPDNTIVVTIEMQYKR